jgi:hypothetical protein
MGMVLGGVGSVRLAPRNVRGGEVCFFGASENGVSHQGVPVIFPLDNARGLLPLIRQHGSAVVSLKGTLWPLPSELSPIKFDQSVPKFYLFAEHVRISQAPPTGHPLVTVSVVYNSNHRYSGDFPSITFNDKTFNPQKQWCFASFNPAKEGDELPRTIEFIRGYTERNTAFV